MRPSVIVYTGDHPVANALAWAWIRVISVAIVPKRQDSGRQRLVRRTLALVWGTPLSPTCVSLVSVDAKARELCLSR